MKRQKGVAKRERKRRSEKANREIDLKTKRRYVSIYEKRHTLAPLMDIEYIIWYKGNKDTAYVGGSRI